MNTRAVTQLFPWLRRFISAAPSHFCQSAIRTLCVIGLLPVLSGGLHADELRAAEELVNTIWVTENGYSYVAVTTDGTVESIANADFYIEFLETKGEVLVARVRWISPEEQLSEFQHLLFVPDGAGGFSFQAAGALDVVGGAANGNMRPVGDDTALFTSFNLENDRAGAINTTLNKVNVLPAKFEAEN